MAPPKLGCPSPIPRHSSLQAPPHGVDNNSRCAAGPGTLHSGRARACGTATTVTATTNACRERGGHSDAQGRAARPPLDPTPPPPTCGPAPYCRAPRRRSSRPARTPGAGTETSTCAHNLARLCRGRQTCCSERPGAHRVGTLALLVRCVTHRRPSCRRNYFAQRHEAPTTWVALHGPCTSSRPALLRSYGRTG